MKKILCIDFDGVIHSYKSGWQGEHIVADEPVEGAFKWLMNIIGDEEFINDSAFHPVIYSSRSKSTAGINAMKVWFIDHGFPASYLKHLEFATEKPPAWLTIDDRAFHFVGKFPTIEFIENFKPWNKQ